MISQIYLVVNTKNLKLITMADDLESASGYVKHYKYSRKKLEVITDPRQLRKYSCKQLTKLYNEIIDPVVKLDSLGHDLNNHVGRLWSFLCPGQRRKGTTMATAAEKQASMAKKSARRAAPGSATKKPPPAPVRKKAVRKPAIKQPPKSLFTDDKPKKATKEPTRKHRETERDKQGNRITAIDRLRKVFRNKKLRLSIEEVAEQMETSVVRVRTVISRAKVAEESFIIEKDRKTGLYKKI